MLSSANIAFMLSVIMLNAIMLIVIFAECHFLFVLMLTVVTPKRRIEIKIMNAGYFI